jgi:hypothetical protein
MERWTSLIRDHHPATIRRAHFERNRRRLREENVDPRHQSRMELPPLTKRRLFVYVSPEELQSRPDWAPFAARLGGPFKPEQRAFVLEFDNAAEREALRVDLFAAGILASNAAPLSAKTESVWRGFLSGAGGRLSPAPLALLFGPLWYLYHGLYAKFWLLASAAGAAGLLDWLGEGPWGTAAGVAQLVLLFLLLFLYPCLLGRWDRYLQQARGERLWPSLPYEKHKGVVWGTAVIGLVCWIAGWIAGSTVGAGESIYISLTPKGGAKTAVLGVEGYFKRRRGEVWLGKAKPSELLAKWTKDVEAGYGEGDGLLWHEGRFRAQTPLKMYCLTTIPAGLKEVKLYFADHPEPAAVGANYRIGCVVTELRRGPDGAQEVHTLALVIPVEDMALDGLEARLPSAGTPQLGTVGEFQAGSIQGKRYRRYFQTTTRTTAAGAKTWTVLGDAYLVDVGDGTKVGLFVWFSDASEADVDGFARETLSTLTLASR